MSRLIKKHSKTRGLKPGTVVFVGDQKVEKTRIRMTDFDVANIEEKEVSSIDDCFPFKDKPSVTWINIDGLHDVDLIERLGKHFDLHPLIMEDIANTGQRPKLETSDEYLFLVLKMLQVNDSLFSDFQQGKG